MKRAEILDRAKEYVTNDRQNDHGKPEDTFRLIGDLWGSYLGTFLTSSDVANLMILMKVARAKGNPTHIDNWVDAAGYAACGGELSEELFEMIRTANRGGNGDSHGQ